MKAVRRFERELERFIHAMETTLRGAPIDAAAQLRESMIQCLKTLRQYDVSDRWGLLSQTEYENRVIAECGGLLLQEGTGKGEEASAGHAPTHAGAPHLNHPPPEELGGNSGFPI